MPRVENLVFFTEGAFSNRDYTRFGVAHLQEEGFRVEAWDLSRVLHPDAVPPDQLPAALPGGFTPRQFTGKGEVLHAIGEMRPGTLVNCFVGYSVSSLFIYRALSKRRIPYAVTATNALPAPERITRTLTPDLPKKALSRLVQTTILRLYPLFGVQPAFLCLAGGDRSLASLSYPVDIKGGRTTLLPVHTLDYDLYLESRGPEPPALENFAVFLDGNDFHHQDLRFMKEPVPGWMDEYFSQLRGFFDVLERELDTRIVIAAHPEARYTPEQKAQFGEREVVQGRTADLVRRCR
ncbi:MAG: hypothetical protein LUO97_03050, partial [Methanomicrobiales archaeon]|nr:hypothetical protein [Methanomicrobiales archaeon]